jgi:hypothetical protein
MKTKTHFTEHRRARRELWDAMSQSCDDTRRYAAELVALAPDLIFAPGI